MIGQISNEEFISNYPNAKKNCSTNKAITFYGRNTVNYWIQHSDNSWTNYDCKTVY